MMSAQAAIATMVAIAEQENAELLSLNMMLYDVGPYVTMTIDIKGEVLTVELRHQGANSTFMAQRHKDLLYVRQTFPYLLNDEANTIHMIRELASAVILHALEMPENIT